MSLTGSRACRVQWVERCVEQVTLLDFFITFLDPCFLAKVMNTIFPVEKTVEKKIRSVPKITDSYCRNFQKLGPKS